jgi:hypothetical protein
VMAAHVDDSERGFSDALLDLDHRDISFDLKSLTRRSIQDSVERKINSAKLKIKTKHEQALNKLRTTSPIHFKNKISFAVGP